MRLVSNYLQLFVIMIICGITYNKELYSQRISPDIIGNAGTEMKSEKMGILWTLGELAVKDYSDTKPTIAEGFLGNGLLPITTSQDHLIIGDVEVYPNPTNNFVRIVPVHMTIGGKIEVYNIHGQKIKLHVNNNYIDFTPVVPGQYLLFLRTKEEYFLSKLITKI